LLQDGNARARRLDLLPPLGEGARSHTHGLLDGSQLLDVLLHFLVECAVDVLEETRDVCFVSYLVSQIMLTHS
jgi:hypothetical protein